MVSAVPAARPSAIVVRIASLCASGNGKAGRIGHLNHFVRDASKEQPGQGAEASPTKHNEVRTSHSGKIDNDTRWIADVNQCFDVLDSSLARTELRRLDDIPARRLEHLILGLLHMFHASQVRQLGSHPSLKDGSNDV
jgi:hypothetical protein